MLCSFAVLHHMCRPENACAVHLLRLPSRVSFDFGSILTKINYSHICSMEVRIFFQSKLCLLFLNIYSSES
jgi:hypothetical protein